MLFYFLDFVFFFVVSEFFNDLFNVMMHAKITRDKKMIEFLGIIFISFTVFIFLSIIYGIIKGIFDLIKDMMISLLIWMGDEELMKKRDEKRDKDLLKYDTYQG